MLPSCTIVVLRYLWRVGYDGGLEQAGRQCNPRRLFFVGCIAVVSWAR